MGSDDEVRRNVATWKLPDSMLDEAREYTNKLATQSYWAKSVFFEYVLFGAVGRAPHLTVVGYSTET